jgi:hypothetical protein
MHLLVMIALAGAFAMMMGIHVRDILKYGTLTTGILTKSIWAALIFACCAALITTVELDRGDAVTGSLYVVVYFIGVVGMFALPVLLWIIAMYSFGYLYWIIGGRKRNVALPAPVNAAPGDAKGVKGPDNPFGKRSGNT